MVISRVLIICSVLILIVKTDICITPNSTEGECISIYECESLNQTYNDLSAENYKFFRQSQCGYTGTTPKVCCPKSELQRPFILPKRPVKPTTLILNTRLGEDETEIKCGIQYSDDRIFDGTITELHEFPWMALLAYQTEKGVGLACGGVLINKKFVLTAAHCTKGKAVQKVGKLVAVRLGEHNILTSEDCDTDYIDDEICAPPPVDIFVESIHPHPDYVPDTPNRYHDIALLKLQGEVKFTDYVQPICLPTTLEQSNTFSTAGLSLDICGWGQTENKTGSSIKLKAKVPVISKDDCKRPYETNGIQIGATQICAGGGTADSCKGDSGGPLMYHDKSNSMEYQWYTVGVISFGAEPCAKPDVPAVYTRIGSYLDWIYKTMQI